MISNIKFEKLERTYLANAVTYSILQDSHGFIWFGTDDGLIRYDGYNVKIFKTDRYNKNSLQDDFITSIYSHSSGKLLIGTDRSHLFEYDSKLENFFEIPLYDCDPKHHITSIIEDKYFNTWIGTFGNGLYRLDKKLNFSYHFKTGDSEDDVTINNNNVRCIHFDNLSSKLFIGTNGGLNIYDYTNNCFVYLVSDSKNFHLLSSNRINFIYRDSRKILWVGTDNGLNKFEDEKYKFSIYYHDPLSKNSLSGNNTLSICEDNQGYLWIGTAKDGLNCFDIENNKFLRFKYNKNNVDGIVGNTIECLFKDKTNVIWIGTDAAGIGKVDRQQKNFYHIINKSADPNQHKSNFVGPIFKDYRNNLWIGFETGLYKCVLDSDDNFMFSKFSELPSTQIFGISEDSQNNLWINCRNHGIYSINILENKITSTSSEIFKEYIDSPFAFCQFIDRVNRNHIWLGLPNAGLLKLDMTTGKFIDYDKIPNTLKNITVYSLYMDSEGFLWVGSRGNGLFKYDINQGFVTNFIYDTNDNDSISDNTINCTTEDEKNNIWIGTMSAGLNLYDKSENTFKRFSEKEEVYGILVDKRNNLWMSTNNGISKFDPFSETIVTYNKMDGLQDNEFNTSAYHKSKDGIMYFGGVNGITYFRPDEIYSNHHIPNVVITDFQIFNESIKPSSKNLFLKKSITETKEIILSYRESVFSFEFAALIYNNPSKNQYAYMMEGFDRDWVYCGSRRQATYTNLNPGQYIFRVKGSNNDGVWNEEGSSVRLIITPPWYGTIWFKGLTALSIIGGIRLMFQQRVEKMKKEKRQQEEFTKKLIESQENDRKRIAAELHDSLGQDLAIIKNKALISIKKTDDPKVKEQMIEISNLTSSTINEVREISYNLRPYELDRLGLIKTLQSLVDRASKSTNINFFCDIDNIDKVFIPEVEINIYRIIQECLTNIIKHSEATEVVVHLKKLEKVISIFISDNGKGFDVKNNNLNSQRKGFGLKGIPERVKLFGGSFDIESEFGKGTKIKIIIPVKD